MTPADNPQTKVLLLWKPEATLLNHLRSKVDKRIELICPPNTEEATLIELSAEVEAMVGWRPTPELIESAPALRLFINPGAGVQHLTPVFENTAFRGPIVNGHGNAFYTAQNTVALLLALAGKIVTHHNLMLAGKWRTGDKEGKAVPLKNRRVGLLGYGHVNRWVHQFLQPYGCHFNLLKRKWKTAEIKEAKSVGSHTNSFTPDQLRDFLQQTDILIAAVPLSPATKGLIDEAAIAHLPEDALIVNVSRGAVFEEKALFEALDKQRITGAAIDVWYNYKPEPNANEQKFPYTYPFHELPNVVLSPHRAASPFDSLDRWDDVIFNLNALVNGDDYINIVDLEQGY